MKLLSDIGINLDGMMYILFNEGTELPIEETFIIEINTNDPILEFYQGLNVYVKNNMCLGKLQLLNTKRGMFELKCQLEENKLKLFINEYSEEFLFINKEIGNKNIEEEKMRDLENHKYMYIKYINETLNTLEQIKDKIDERIIIMLKNAKQIIYVEDVTIEEFKLALRELEEKINPILNNLTPSSTAGIFT